MLNRFVVVKEYFSNLVFSFYMILKSSLKIEFYYKFIAFPFYARIHPALSYSIFPTVHTNISISQTLLRPTLRTVIWFNEAVFNGLILAASDLLIDQNNEKEIEVRNFIPISLRELQAQPYDHSTIKKD